jgi:phage terminase large subunit-like protein
MGIPFDISQIETAAPAWDLSCLDWEARIREERSLVPDTLPLYEDEARIALEFFDNLRLPDVEGNPLLRDAAGQWFRDIVRVLFGARDPVSGTRFIRELFALVGKGNSKTSYSAALMVVALLMNKAPKAEFHLIAPHQDTAQLAFDQASGMIALDPELKRRFHPRDHIKEIIDRFNGSKMKIKTFSLDALVGPKPTGVLLDELHQLGKLAITTKALRQIRGGLEKRTDGFFLIITTQSDEPPAGAFKAELATARAIRDGEMQGRMLPILYEFPEDIATDPDKWQDPANWPMVMPNLGRSLHIRSLIADWNTERGKGQESIAVWASQHLNIEPGKGMKNDAWKGAKFWDRRADQTLTLDALIERSEVIVVGIDGGGLDDLFGLCVMGREIETKKWLIWTHAWVHEDVLEDRKSIAAVLLEAKDADELTIVDDQLKDISDIVGIIEKLKESDKLSTVAVDPAGLGEFVDEMDKIGITVENGMLEGVRQGIALMSAMKTTERKLAAGTMIHSGSGLAGWCVGNVKIERLATSIRATKANAGDAKIDIAMAVWDAACVMSDNPQPKSTKSIYEERGLRFA